MAGWRRSHVAALLPILNLLTGCSRIPDCDADVTLSTLSQQLKEQVDQRFREQLRPPTIPLGSIQLNPRKLAEAARTDPVRTVFSDMQTLVDDSNAGHQCRVKVAVTVDIRDRPQPLEKAGWLRFSVFANEPGFRLHLDENDVATLLQ